MVSTAESAGRTLSKQLVRQLDTLRELQAARYGLTVHELAQEYGVKVRTVQRDLWDLREAGFILGEERRDQRVYYKLDKETGLPLNFPVLEVAAMIFAERAGLGLAGTPFGEHLRSGVRRLTAAMAPEMRQFLERAADAYVPLARGHKPYEEAPAKPWRVLNRGHSAAPRLPGELPLARGGRAPPVRDRAPALPALTAAGCT